MFRRTSLVVVCLLALAGILAMAGPVSANKPTRFFEHQVSFVCDPPGVTTPDGTVVASAFDHSDLGADANVSWWVPPDTIENSEEATYRSSALITDQQVTRTDYHFDAVLKMEDRDFNPVGEAIIDVDLIPTGEVTEGEGKSRFGNRTVRDKSSVKFFSVSGTVTINLTGQDPVVFDVTNCNGPDGAPADHAGFDTTIDITTTDPSQFVIRAHDGILILCDLAGDDYVAGLRASADETGSGGDLSFVGFGRTLGGEMTDLTLTPTEFSATIPLIDFDTEEPAGDAIVDATFTRGQRLTLRVEENGLRSKRVGWLLNVTGTLTVPTEPATVVDLSSCFAFDGTEQVKEHRPDEVPE